MNYARIENGVVADALRVPPANIYPPAYALQFIEAPDGVVRGWLYSGEEFSAPPPAVVVPPPISPRQIRMALSRASLRASVEAAVAAGDQDLQDWYEFSTSFERDHPLVDSMGTALGQTSEQLDALWILGASL